MKCPPKIFKAELAALKQDMLTLPEDYKRQIKGAGINKVYRSVEAFKRDYLTLHWLHLYVGSRGKKVALVVKELFSLYPEFKREIARKRTTFPAVEGQLNCDDEDLLQLWMRKQPGYYGKGFGAIAWLGFRSSEVNWFFVWRKQLRYTPEGPAFMSYEVWFEKMRAPPKNVLAEVKVTAEDYKAVAKGLPSVAQLYADHGGKVMVVPVGSWGEVPSELRPAIDKAYLMKKLRELNGKIEESGSGFGDRLPHAVSAKDLARLFSLSERTIQRWDRDGFLTRYKGPHAGEGKKAPVRYNVKDFIRFMETNPESRIGRTGSRAGDWVR